MWGDSDDASLATDELTGRRGYDFLWECCGGALHYRVELLCDGRSRLSKRTELAGMCERDVGNRRASLDNRRLLGFGVTGPVVAGRPAYLPRDMASVTRYRCVRFLGANASFRNASHALPRCVSCPPRVFRRTHIRAGHETTGLVLDGRLKRRKRCSFVEDA